MRQKHKRDSGLLRIIFAGSPNISSVLLKDLLEKQGNFYKVVGVLTNPPSVQKRKSTLIPTPVEEVARKYQADNNISEGCDWGIFTPLKLDGECREKIQSLNPDLLVCFAYGKIFGPKFMALFPKGGINVHPSLLPKYRGCAPVPAAILALEKQTGITVQRLAQEMDTGDVLLQKIIDLDGTENSESLLDFCAESSCPMVQEVLEKIADGSVVGTPQEGEPSYCTMLKKEDGLIDWSKTAEEIDGQIRAFYPWPSTFTKVGENQLQIHCAKLYYGDVKTTGCPGKVLKADKQNGILVETGNGILALENLQWQTKKAMGWKDFINGAKDFEGKILGQ